MRNGDIYGCHLGIRLSTSVVDEKHDKIRTQVGTEGEITICERSWLMTNLCYWMVCCTLMGNLMAHDGNAQLQRCKSHLRAIEDRPLRTDGLVDIPNAEGGVCVGYTMGVIDTHKQLYVDLNVQTFCIPEAVHTNQLIRVTVKYLENNPNRLHYLAASLVKEAFEEAFPCSEGN